MKYRHISQKPYCCVPACVQMVLDRRKLHMRSQADIAYDLGVILPPKDRHLLPKSCKGRKPKAGWGTRINFKKYSLSAFFERNKYPLRAKFYPPRNLQQFRKILPENIKRGNDLLILFNYPLLYRSKGKWGHASLIENIKGKYARLCDPGPRHKKTRKVLLNDLFASLNDHHDGGIWVIRSLN